jgi:hypothetical protein
VTPDCAPYAETNPSVRDADDICRRACFKTTLRFAKHATESSKIDRTELLLTAYLPSMTWRLEKLDIDLGEFIQNRRTEILIYFNKH